MSPAEQLPLHAMHAAAGAAFAERAGRRIVASYGDPAAEYEAALEGAGLIDLAERDVLVVSGPKRQSFLQGMLSNDVEGCQAGQGCRAALMTAKGGLRYLLRVLVEKDVIRLETDADRRDSLRKALELYRVAAPVQFASEPRAVLGLLGMEAARILKDQAIEPPVTPEGHARVELAGRELVLARAGDLPGGGFVLHVAPEDAQAVWEVLAGGGARPVGRDALDARRVEDLRPWYGFDITEANLLHETGLLPELHSSTKGCYIGQEVVARLEARGGKVNKALRRLRLSAPSAPGGVLLAGEKEVGRVSTAATSPRVGPIALAWVHRSHFDPGSELSVEGSPATVVGGFDQE